MIKLTVFARNRRETFYVTDEFLDAPKSDHTQLKKETEEFREYIRKMREKEDGVRGQDECENAKAGNENYSIQDELAKALYRFSYGGLTVEQAEKRAEEVMKNFDPQNEVLAHKGINWYAKQILKSMYKVKIEGMSEKQLLEEGLQALEERLGIVGTIRFLQQFDNGGSGDYTKEKYDKENEPAEEEMAKLLSEWLAEGKDTI